MSHIITSVDKYQLSQLKDGNQIIGDFKFDSSKVTFYGNGNILISRDDKPMPRLLNTTISFWGSNSVVFLGENFLLPHHIDLHMFNNSFCYIGTHTTMGLTKTIPIMCADGVNLFIGDDNMIADGAHFKLSDGHPIYSVGDKNKFVNPAKSIFIGDHAWIAINSLLLKGTKIGSGSTIGANSVVSGKTIPSNTIWGGNPARQLKKDVFHLTGPINAQTKDTYEGNDYIYHLDKTVITFEELESAIIAYKTSLERANFMLEFNKSPKTKNRFYIAP